MSFDAPGAAAAVRDLLLSFGADPDSPELRDTPRRVAEFWAERLAGTEADPSLELVPLPGDLASCPVILERVPFVSTCEHHLAPFEGYATIGYLPGVGGTVGLSKLVKVVHGFANRLQVQERLTHEIASALETRLRPAAWGVKLVAIHTCMSHRGARTPDVPVTTQVLGGAWEKEPPGPFRN
ncbi:GTP cyclohydrolase I [Mesoterricola sediminis]|uniref:GTP cyclohydrolase I n=1 Tax=Mesoterricola sediminis TaxID=2927980 RepID=A0AA48KCD4_9BACT|nr:GTP cyclohydrolase I [Mesoterricola sediminis]BDU75950.1 GTP cyclohydrolase 1 [Mesoterricola sediminis]